MSTVELNFVNKSVTKEFANDAWLEDSNSYHCHLLLVKEDDGSFSAIVLNLPGAGSCGATEEEAVENAKEAVIGAIEAHVEAGEDIPWVDSRTADIPDGAHQKWVIVNA